MSEREQIITFLLQACDGKDQAIAKLQARVAELEKQNAAQVVAQPVST